MNRFMEGFDYGLPLADIARRFTQRELFETNADDAIESAAGGHGSIGLRLSTTGADAFGHSSGRLRKVLGNVSGNIAIVGFLFRSPTPFANLRVNTDPTLGDSTDTLLGLLRASAFQCWFRLNTNGTISAYRGSTLLGTTAVALQQNVQQYVEFKVTVATGAGGAIDVYIDNVNQLSLSGINTANTGTSGWDEFCLGPCATSVNSANSSVWHMDDLYVNDGSGGENDDVWGTVQIMTDLPTGDGDDSVWAPSAGSNFQNVDDAAPDDDATYNEAATAGDRDLYTFPSWAAAGEIKAVEILALARKTDAGTSTVKVVTKSGGTLANGATQGLGSTYAYISEVFDQDPIAAAPWDPASTPQFGLEKVV